MSRRCIWDSAKYEIPILKVPERVAKIMGGQILELECVKQWNARIEVSREQVMEYYQTI